MPLCIIWASLSKSRDLVLVEASLSLNLLSFRYGSVERYAGFALEGCHQSNKKHMASSNFLRYGKANAARQQLEQNSEAVKGAE